MNKKESIKNKEVNMTENFLVKKNGLMKANIQPARYGMAVSGVLLLSFGCSLCIFADFGIAPFQSFSMGLNRVAGFGLSYGTYYMLLNLLMLAIPLILNRKLINISTFINIFLFGYLIDWTTTGLGRLLPAPGLFARLTFLVTGLVIMSFSCALYYVADLGVSPYDAIPLILTEKMKLPFRLVRSATDLLCVAVGLICGITVGFGTLATALFMGPLISIFKILILHFV